MYNPTKPYNKQTIKTIKKTWGNRVVEVGPYAMVEMGNKRLGLFHTDGIGTKGYLHWKQGTFKAAAQDALAMNVDDSIMVGVYPEVVVDHLMLEKQNELAIFEFTNELSNLCKKMGIIIAGGETAITNTIKGMEAGITTYGTIAKKDIIKPKVRPGDKVIGIESSGIHSNGITLAIEGLSMTRQNVEEGLLKCTLPYKPYNTIGQELTIPTHIYLPSLEEVVNLNRKQISSMMHITGGAFTKLLDIAGDNLIHITRDNDLNPQKLFRHIMEGYALSSSQMYEFFNCGIGYVITCRPNVANDIVDILNEKFHADIIGKVSKSGRPAVKIESKLSKETLTYYNGTNLSCLIEKS
jgi:phosphoribosylformylglycinamidine cyclo-ligase